MARHHDMPKTPASLVASSRRATLVTMLLCLGVVFSACERGASTPSKTTDARRQITVFAAASTADVMRTIAETHEKRTGVQVVFSFDSSSTLAKQIKAGGPAEVFISADQKWMDDVDAAGSLAKGSRIDLLANRLVLVAPKDRPFEARLAKDFDFDKSLPDVRRIAIGDPAHVPAGRYAKQALEWLGWWQALEHRLIPASDVRAALRLVELGEADAGIVYSTDSRVSGKVRLIAEFPQESHEPVRYPAALTVRHTPDAAAFLRSLRDVEATVVFETAGFQVIGRDGAN